MDPYPARHSAHAGRVRRPRRVRRARRADWQQQSGVLVCDGAVVVLRRPEPGRLQCLQQQAGGGGQGQPRARTPVRPWVGVVGASPLRCCCRRDHRRVLWVDGAQPDGRAWETGRAPGAVLPSSHHRRRRGVSNPAHRLRTRPSATSLFSPRLMCFQSAMTGFQSCMMSGASTLIRDLSSGLWVHLIDDWFSVTRDVDASKPCIRQETAVSGHENPVIRYVSSVRRQVESVSGRASVDTRRVDTIDEYRRAGSQPLERMRASGFGRWLPRLPAPPLLDLRIHMPHCIQGRARPTALPGAPLGSASRGFP